MMIRRDLLPDKKEPQKVCRRNRLDLFAQAVERVAVNAREQPARTPFDLERRHPCRRFTGIFAGFFVQ